MRNWPSGRQRVNRAASAAAAKSQSRRRRLSNSASPTERERERDRAKGERISGAKGSAWWHSLLWSKSCCSDLDSCSWRRIVGFSRKRWRSVRRPDESCQSINGATNWTPTRYFYKRQQQQQRRESFALPRYRNLSSSSSASGLPSSVASHLRAHCCNGRARPSHTTTERHYCCGELYGRHYGWRSRRHNN